jgi:hypothetical protein
VNLRELLREGLVARGKKLPRERTPRGVPPDLLALLLDLVPLLIEADEPRAIRKLKDLRRQIRATPELAAGFQLEPPRSRGRPSGRSGSKFEAKALVLTILVDV